MLFGRHQLCYYRDGLGASTLDQHGNNISSPKTVHTHIDWFDLILYSKRVTKVLLLFSFVSLDILTSDMSICFFSCNDSDCHRQRPLESIDIRLIFSVSNARKELKKSTKSTFNKSKWCRLLYLDANEMQRSSSNIQLEIAIRCNKRCHIFSWIHALDSKCDILWQECEQ